MQDWPMCATSKARTTGMDEGWLGAGRLPTAVLGVGEGRGGTHCSGRVETGRQQVLGVAAGRRVQQWFS